MKAVRMVLLGLLIVSLPACSGSSSTGGGGGSSSGGGGGGGDGMAAKLVGTWESTDEVTKGMTIEFTKDHKIKVDFMMKMEGTYKVEGNKLSTTITGPDKKETTKTSTIEKVTDTELEIKGDDGKVAKYKKKS